MAKFVLNKLNSFYIPVRMECGGRLFAYVVEDAGWRVVLVDNKERDLLMATDGYETMSAAEDALAYTVKQICDNMGIECEVEIKERK